MYLFGQTAGASQPSMFSAMIPMIVIFAIMYFLLIMPQRKKQKQLQKMISELKSGDKVITAGGIYGKVKRVMDDRVEIEVSSNTNMLVAKSSVSGLVDTETPKEK